MSAFKGRWYLYWLYEDINRSFPALYQFLLWTFTTILLLPPKLINWWVLSVMFGFVVMLLY